ncbi:aminotransferase class I/II-fold pyridoxal phosphate-dependent enzyme [Xylophilus rhododendri]|uniref:Aminotransferase n=2 Tax=Xylophilus rhododendri TaxID=2697032 RepID=A0A857JCH5_9BURK|nr:aminotransferase class I/II-fold pyridoxal phosphate-dependent enzyme [Xylophilus rhododendri]
MAGQRARALKAQGRDIVSLTTGEPDFPTPPHIIEAAHQAMLAGQTRYTDVGGTMQLREAVAAKFRRENGLDYRTEETIVSTGAKQVVFSALMCTVQAGDEVIVPTPYWVSYPDIVLLAEGKPVFVDCPAAAGFKLQPADLERAITPRTKWLVLNSPNNPSGAAYTAAELAALAEVLARHPQVWVMTDDIYEHLIYDDQPFSTMVQAAPFMRDRTLTVNGTSKAYAMTGWRIGYAAGPQALIKAMVKLQSQSTSNPSSVGQAGALAALTGPQDFIAPHRQLFQRRRDLVVGGLNAIEGIACPVPNGAFYTFASCQGLFGRRTPEGKTIASSDDFTEYLLESQDLAVLQGSAYGVPTHFRISFATSEERLAEANRRIAAAVAALGD